ncbi:hypothetical protein AB0I72_00630 [Nocardiopsis sp. NPDC049922]|uniref:hypothetical protein n=1 Tax=Nocardiopsis sp. NPDC049922 TaxID=3155157 RepID=UPI0033EC6EDE
MSAQNKAAAALAELVREDAPAVAWELPPDHQKLYGLLDAASTHDHFVGLAAWQRVIGAGPLTHATAGEWQHLTATGSYEGVPVEVVAMIPKGEAL